MRLFKKLGSFCCVRQLIIQPENTKNSECFSKGFIALDGSEPIDTVYSLVKAGNFVAPLTKIETIHEVFCGIKKLCKVEFPLLKGEDVFHLLIKQQEIVSKVLIQRDFWSLSDFNDPELNRSFGIQNLFFDNFKWSQVLWKRFQQFVEEYYPISEHSHLRYFEYEELIRSFAIFENGLKLFPLLPKHVRLYPAYGVSVPSGSSAEPLLLLKKWLLNFRRPLMINRALVLHCGCGAAAFAVKLSGVAMVCGIDSRPRAIHGCRSDGQREKKLQGIKFQVGELLPSVNLHKPELYDLVVYYPDEDILEMVGGPMKNIYAPDVAGYAGRLEQFFDEVQHHLSDTGVVAICCTNLMSLLKPYEPHPIEYEIKVNRRYVVLDYYDSLISRKAHAVGGFSGTALPPEMQRKIRSELWILHKLSALSKFGYLHGIPGAQPPTVESKWKGSQMSLTRRRRLKTSVESMGEEWGTYKTRLLSMLQEQSGVEEDDVAEAVRMSLDPTYPLQLADKAKRVIEEKQREDVLFHESVLANYPSRSPRECLDSKLLHRS